MTEITKRAKKSQQYLGHVVFGGKRDGRNLCDPDRVLAYRVIRRDVARLITLKRLGWPSSNSGPATRRLTRLRVADDRTQPLNIVGLSTSLNQYNLQRESRP